MFVTKTLRQTFGVSLHCTWRVLRFIFKEFSNSKAKRRKTEDNLNFDRLFLQHCVHRHPLQIENILLPLLIMLEEVFSSTKRGSACISSLLQEYFNWNRAMTRKEKPVWFCFFFLFPSFLLLMFRNWPIGFELVCRLATVASCTLVRKCPAGVAGQNSNQIGGTMFARRDHSWVEGK